MFFWSRKTEGKVILLIELQSSSAQSSLVWFKEGARPQILSSHHHAMPRRPAGDTDHFVKMAMKSLNETLDSATKRFYHLKAELPNLPGLISESHYVLSTPWAIAHTRSVETSFDHDTKLTEKLIREMVEEDRKEATPNKAADSLMVIEEKILQIRINGYRIDSWRGLNARNLGVSYAISVSSATMADKLITATAKVLPDRPVFFHSSPLLQHIGISKILPGLRCYISAHIHGETTDIALIKQHSSVFFGSYPIGLNSVIRRAHRAAGSDKGLADSLISMHTAGKIDTEHAKSIKASLEKIGSDWITGLRELLSDGGYKGGLPEAAIVMAGSHADFFIESFRRSQPICKAKRLPEDLIAETAEFDRRDSSSDLTGLYVAALCDII